MVSISPRWLSEKLCADAEGSVPQSASANNAGASRRSEGIGKFLLVKAGVRKFVRRLNSFLVALLAGRRFGTDDVVGLDPSGRADSETGFCTRGEVARGLVVVAKEGGLCGSQVGLREIPLSGIGHCELGIADRRLALSRHRRTKNRNR